MTSIFDRSAENLAKKLKDAYRISDEYTEEEARLIGRNALHQLGHLWELHHCLDPRCSMYPPWTPSFPQGDTTFCAFCRDKSEAKIRLAKS